MSEERNGLIQLAPDLAAGSDQRGLSSDTIYKAKKIKSLQQNTDNRIND